MSKLVVGIYFLLGARPPVKLVIEDLPSDSSTALCSTGFCVCSPPPGLAAGTPNTLVVCSGGVVFSWTVPRLGRRHPTRGEHPTSDREQRTGLLPFPFPSHPVPLVPPFTLTAYLLGDAFVIPLCSIGGSACTTHIALPTNAAAPFC